MTWATLVAILHYSLALLVVVRVMLKPGMAASARLAWILVIEVVPFVGVLAWVLFGEVRMERADRRRAADVRQAIADRWEPSPHVIDDLPEPAAAISAQAVSAGGLAPVGGNRLNLLPEGDEAMEAMADAIDAARRSVKVLFYIWLDDVAGRLVAEACANAARRGLRVRVIVDSLGSRQFLRSATWQKMLAAGVEAVEAFPLRNAAMRIFTNRFDLRNHRKIVVLDGRLGFTGSRNCADMAFSPKSAFAPWVDILIAVEGPAVRQLEVVFIQDWLSASKRPLPPPPAPEHAQPPKDSDWTDIDHPESDQQAGDLQARAVSIAPFLPPIPPAQLPGQVVQVLPTGPDFRPGSLSDVLAMMIHAARRRLILTTPYFVPDEAIDAAIRAAARRGVEVTLILPERNDSRLVHAVSNGFHEGLLRAGVRIVLFQDGLIHSKIVTVDGAIALAGSANLDRRSFDLNYEISLLVIDEDFTAALDARQASYLERSRPLTLHEVRARPALRRIAGNVASLAAPLL